MTDGLVAARELAENLRFSGDSTVIAEESAHRDETERLRLSLLHTELRIGEAVTPTLAEALFAAYERLHIPAESVEAFVYPSAELQASCMGGSRECVVRFSSALLDILDPAEIQFVAGHELGHFVLSHRPIDPETCGLDGLILQRAREISVDRIGLVACGSLDIAIRAMMKVASGLTDRHLRFDVRAFVAQLGDRGSHDLPELSGSSHPSILVRCRALLWFSLSEFFARGDAHYSREQIVSLDKRVSRELEQFGDGTARRAISSARDDVLLWAMAYEAVRGGSLGKQDQEAMASVVGPEVVERLKRLLADMPAPAVPKMIRSKLDDARQRLGRLMPLRVVEELQIIDAEIRRALPARRIVSADSA